MGVSALRWRIAEGFFDGRGANGHQWLAWRCRRIAAAFGPGVGRNNRAIPLRRAGGWGMDHLTAAADFVPTSSL